MGWDWVGPPGGVMYRAPFGAEKGVYSNVSTSDNFILMKNVVQSDFSFLYHFDLSASSGQEMHLCQFLKWDLSTVSRRLAQLYFPGAHSLSAPRQLSEKTIIP